MNYLATRVRIKRRSRWLGLASLAGARPRIGIGPGVLESRKPQLFRNPRSFDRVLHKALNTARDQVRDEEGLGTARQRTRVDVLDLAVVRGDARQKLDELWAKAG
jgi:hypothetical protein